MKSPTSVWVRVEEREPQHTEKYKFSMFRLSLQHFLSRKEYFSFIFQNFIFTRIDIIVNHNYNFDAMRHVPIDQIQISYRQLRRATFRKKNFVKFWKFPLQIFSNVIFEFGEPIYIRNANGVSNDHYGRVLLFAIQMWW